jgi:hypothetical protein
MALHAASFYAFSPADFTIRSISIGSARLSGRCIRRGNSTLGQEEYRRLLQGHEFKDIADLADLRPRDMIDIQSFIWVLGSTNTRSEHPAFRRRINFSLDALTPMLYRETRTGRRRSICTATYG